MRQSPSPRADRSSCATATGSPTAPTYFPPNGHPRRSSRTRPAPTCDSRVRCTRRTHSARTLGDGPSLSRVSQVPSCRRVPLEFDSPGRTVTRCRSPRWAQRQGSLWWSPRRRPPATPRASSCWSQEAARPSRWNRSTRAPPPTRATGSRFSSPTDVLHRRPSLFGSLACTGRSASHSESLSASQGPDGASRPLCRAGGSGEDAGTEPSDTTSRRHCRSDGSPHGRREDARRGPAGAGAGRH